MAGFPKAGDEYDGRYRIVRQLGHGGMGVVYEAVDKVLNRSVALKIVLPSLPDREDYQQRFAREANVLARIRSRNIVGIHEYGEHEDTVYFVTELFPDGDLHSWLAQHGPLDRRAALALVAQVCEALADAHDAGVIHRDVKPGNVLLWSRPEGLIPYLCDFGIAVDQDAKRASLTRTGTLIGSPAYMAPERHFGHAADERGDVYSVGCLLWAALTGDAPYSGTDFQMMNSHINGPVPHLGTGHPVDDRIDAVLAGALNKDPERRTPSPAVMRTEILAIIKDIDSAAVPPPLPPSTPAGAAATGGDAGQGEDQGEDQDEDRTRASAMLGAALAAPAVTPEAADPFVARADADVPVEAASEPLPSSGPHTVIRDLPAPPAPPAAPVTAAASGGGPRRRRWLVPALVAAALVAVGTTAVVAATTGGDSTPQADPTPSAPTSASSPSASAAPLPTPAAPKLTAKAGYRSVAFTVYRPARAAGLTQALQVDSGDGWTTATGKRVVVATRQGGDRGCLRARAVVSDGSGAEQPGKVARLCTSSAPRVVRLVRTNDACSNGAGCHWYNVYAEGFASGVAPKAFIYDSPGHPWCQCDFRPIHIGKDGRGAQVHEWQVAPGAFARNVTLSIDGVTEVVYVP
ncbi:MAG: serine/threonine-protein kinase [Nocardioides sp.]